MIYSKSEMIKKKFFSGIFWDFFLDLYWLLQLNPMVYLRIFGEFLVLDQFLVTFWILEANISQRTDTIHPNFFWEHLGPIRDPRKNLTFGKPSMFPGMCIFQKRVWKMGANRANSFGEKPWQNVQILGFLWLLSGLTQKIFIFWL